MGAVQSGSADFSIMDFTILEVRSKAVDFTIPFLVDDTLLFMQRPNRQSVR